MNWKIALAIMSAAVFMMGGSYTMVIPFLPLFIARDLGAAPENVNLLTGVAFSISFVITFIAAPIWGRLADLYGRKTMFLRSCFTITICYFLFFIVRNPTELILARALQGFGAGMLPIALSITSAWAPKEKIGIAMGTLQGVHISGTVFGPLFGGLLADSFGVRSAFLIAGFILLFLGVLVTLTVREPKKREDTKNSEKGTYRRLLHDSVILTVLSVTSLTAMVWLMQQPLMALFTSEVSGNAEKAASHAGIIFSVFGLAGAIAAPIWGWCGQRFGFFRMMVTSGIAGAICCAAVAFSSSFSILIAAFFVYGFCFAGIIPSANSILILATRTEIRSSAFSLQFTAQMLGSAIGPVTGGMVATAAGNVSAVFITAGSSLLVFMIIIAFAAPDRVRRISRTNRSGLSEEELRAAQAQEPDKTEQQA